MTRLRKRKAFFTAILKKQVLLKTLYGDDKEELAQRLCKFSELQSKQWRDEAQALGVQDALEARSAQKETVDSVPAKEVAMRTKQVLPALRNQAIIRAA